MFMTFEIEPQHRADLRPEIHLVVFYSQKAYPGRLRRIRYSGDEGRELVFLTNHMTLPTPELNDVSS